ncbi:SET and MYND domain-containing protein 4 [Onthophagus taurus]|uniref:SET and MYND domain-containing protein 4 n=1 Tax=Onthophagus taurus TaxID=166361 RepID=UPI000C20F82F|nr:SET and MYND domain-containing protein 4 [Onthophagus taurus]
MSNNVKVNDIFECLCRALSRDAKVNETSQEFSALNSNWERVDYSLKLIKKYKLSPKFETNKKNDLVSIQYRVQGNTEFNETNYQLALMFYTKSIAFATNNSKALGLAYANRSVVLLRKDFYAQCLKDIDRALNNQYPEDLAYKLELRRSKCKKPPRQQTELSYYNPPPIIEHPNQLINCASSSIKINKSEELGRHVLAVKNIPIGDVIAVEEPYSKLLLKDFIYSYCSNCLELCYDLIPCDGCIYALFCSEKCKESAWKLYHQYECPIITMLYHLELTKLNLLALRITLQARDIFGIIDKFNKNNKVYKSDSYEEIHFLEGNTHLRNSADLFPRSVTAAVIFNLLENHTDFIKDLKQPENDEKTVKELILRHLQTGPTNFHEISECREDYFGDFESSVETGAGAFSFMSLINHSCNPNVLRVCHGSKIVLRALRPIKKGEELLDNYGYHFAVNNKNERQRELKRQYFFDCKCEACEQNWPQFNNLQVRTKGFDINEDTLAALLHGDLVTAKKCLPLFQSKAQSSEDLRPCRVLASIQETIKRCYALFGNKSDRI